MKYEFGSPHWLAALHGIIVERAATEIKTKPRLSMSTCSVFTQAPAHIAGPDRKVAWSCVISGENVDFELRERDDVRTKSIADYAATLPLARYIVGDAPERAAELRALVQDLAARGGIKTIGASLGDPDEISSIHDAIAALTL